MSQDDPIKCEVFSVPTVRLATLQKAISDYFEEHPLAHSIKMVQSVCGNSVQSVILTVLYREPSA